MGSLDEKRQKFRKYLEDSGAIENLTKALTKLYEERNRPDDSVKFLRKLMCETCPDEDKYKALEQEFEKSKKQVTDLKREFDHFKDNLKRTPSQIEEFIKTGNENLSKPECNSLLKKALNGSYDKDNHEYKDSKTTFNGTILDCIQSGMENIDSNLGIYACDPEAYDVFKNLFDVIVKEYHNIQDLTQTPQPAIDWGDPCKLPKMDDAEKKYIVSTRIRCGRSIEKFPFHPLLTQKQYMEIQDKLIDVCPCLSGEFKGKYHKLAEMAPELKKELIKEHLLYKEEDKYLKAAKAQRFWPDGRGIYISDNKKFVIWCNEEDHLRIIFLEQGGNISQVYEQFSIAVEKISKQIPFVHHNELGFLTFCPSNIGTGIRASVHIKLPKLAEDEAKFDGILKTHNLQKRGTDGEHSESPEGVFDISNKTRLGITEYNLMEGMINGIKELIKEERLLNGDVPAPDPADPADPKAVDPADPNAPKPADANAAKSVASK